MALIKISGGSGILIDTNEVKVRSVLYYLEDTGQPDLV